jgi:hypothetical protein
MRIDFTSENLLTLAQAANSLPGRPSASSLWRWARRGINGVKLEYLRVGRKIFVTPVALNRFFQNLAAADQPISHGNPKQKQHIPTERAAAIQQATKALQHDGI